MDGDGDAVRAAGALSDRLPVSTGRCLLRLVRQGDVPAVLDYRRLPEVAQFLGHPPLDLRRAEDLVAGWVRDSTAVTVVAELDGRVVGDVRLRFRRSSAMSPATTEEVDAALGYAFHPQVQGQGLATECAGTVLELVLRPPLVRRVTARVFAPAARSARLLDRLGFSRDGIDRSAVLAPDGAEWWDDELWSLLPGEGDVLRDRDEGDVLRDRDVLGDGDMPGDRDVPGDGDMLHVTPGEHSR